MIEIPLTQGKVAIIDDEDAYLAQFHWYARRDRRTYYAGSHGTGAMSGSRIYLLHRLILRVFDRSIHVDHRNGNGLDCRRANLRVATHQENGANRRIGVTNTSGFKGVRRRYAGWSAFIKLGGKQRWLGTFPSAECAAAAYDAAAREHFGPFAALNFPTGSERAA